VLCKARPLGQLLQRQAPLSGLFFLCRSKKPPSARENLACSLAERLQTRMSSSPWQAPPSAACPPRRATLQTGVANCEKEHVRRTGYTSWRSGPFWPALPSAAAPPTNHTTNSEAPCGQSMGQVPKRGKMPQKLVQIIDVLPNILELGEAIRLATWAAPLEEAVESSSTLTTALHRTGRDQVRVKKRQ
jgi:hypothetical protein